MTKEEIIDQLKNDVYCRLIPTKHGIGVMAIVDIPEAIDPFKGCMPDCEFIAISQEDFDLIEMNDSVRKIVTDFCPLQDGYFYLPSTGLNAIDKSYYLNHSKTPNMFTPDDGETFLAARLIEAGEELTVDYDSYDENKESFRE